MINSSEQNWSAILLHCSKIHKADTKAKGTSLKKHYWNQIEAENLHGELCYVMRD